MTTTNGVVLIHGAWHDHHTWDSVVPLLEAAGVTVKAIDLPGAGANAAIPFTVPFPTRSVGPDHRFNFCGLNRQLSPQSPRSPGESCLNRVMDVAHLLLDLYGRVPPLARRAVSGLNTEQLCRLPAEGTNSIGWLVWHLARVQDHQLGEVFAREQVWVSGDWAQTFGLDPDPSNLGYGHSAADVATVQPENDAALLHYLAAVEARTCELLEPLTATDLDRVVDDHYDPPVTLGVRLISVADDCLQHVGQANYLRGMFGWL